PEAVFDPRATTSHTAKASRRAPEKAHQPVRLAQRKCLENDGFRFPGGHNVGAPTALRSLRRISKVTNAKANNFSITRFPAAQLFGADSAENLPKPRGHS